MVVAAITTRCLRTSPFFCLLSETRARVLQPQLRNLAIQKRSITQNWLRKQAEAKEAWGVQAQEIRDGKKESMLSILEQRGYVNSVAG